MSRLSLWMQNQSEQWLLHKTVGSCQRRPKSEIHPFFQTMTAWISVQSPSFQWRQHSVVMPFCQASAWGQWWTTDPSPLSMFFPLSVGSQGCTPLWELPFPQQRSSFLCLDSKPPNVPFPPTLSTLWQQYSMSIWNSLPIQKMHFLCLNMMFAPQERRKQHKPASCCSCHTIGVLLFSDKMRRTKSKYLFYVHFNAYSDPDSWKSADKL